jgi:hypothetical protein
MIDDCENGLCYVIQAEAKVKIRISDNYNTCPIQQVLLGKKEVLGM